MNARLNGLFDEFVKIVKYIFVLSFVVKVKYYALSKLK